MNQRDGLTGKDERGLAASRGNSARNVGSRIHQVEGLELATKRHTLLQLPKVRILESRSQLGLSGKHQREELCGGRLDVREQSYLLEQLDTKALGLVYHERRCLPASLPFAKETLEKLEEKRLGPACLRAEIELEGKQPNKLVSVKSGIIEVNAPDVATPLGFEGRPYECCLANPGLTNQHGKRFCRKEAVLQDAKCLTLPGREEQIFGVCRQLERALRQT